MRWLVRMWGGGFRQLMGRQRVAAVLPASTAAQAGKLPIYYTCAQIEKGDSWCR